MRILFDDQLNAVEKLRKYKVGALFMEAGTGKTTVACELIKSVENIDLILWLVPCQIKENLMVELDKLGLTNYNIVGIESLSSSDRIYLETLKLVEKAKKPFIICDESLKIKNWDAKRTQRIIEIGK